MYTVAAAAAAGAAASASALVYDYLVLEPVEFLKLVNKLGRKAVVIMVVKRSGIISKKDTFIYVVKYGGFTALTRTYTPLPLSGDVEVAVAKEIVLPNTVWMKLNSIKQTTP